MFCVVYMTDGLPRENGLLNEVLYMYCECVVTVHVPVLLPLTMDIELGRFLCRQASCDNENVTKHQVFTITFLVIAEIFCLILKFLV